VGGTTPTCAGDPSYCNGYGSEIAWSRSGGGASRAFPRPAFQKGCGVPKGTKRLVPDVALAADPAPGYVYRLAGAWRFTGGTALGAPPGAGLFAQVDPRHGGPPLGPPGERPHPPRVPSARHRHNP